MTVGEVKRNENKINQNIQEEKFAALRPHFRGDEVDFVALSMENV